MYSIKFTNRFKKDLIRCKKKGYDISLIKKAILLLETNGKLPKEYKTHSLSGNYAGFLECHVKPDWLMVWRQNDTELILLFTNTGTHSDLF